MLNTLIGLISKKKNITELSLLTLILLFGLSSLLKASPKPADIKKNKYGKSSALQSGIEQTNPICSPQFERSEKGQWCTAFDSSIPAVHMSVLPDGRILYWGADVVSNNLNHKEYQIWNPSFPIVYTPGSNQNPKTHFTDTSLNLGNFFCSGHSFLPDGKLLVTGGQENSSNDYPKGSNKAAYFNYDQPETSHWTPLPNMNDRRWYPTNLTLGSGDVLVWGGLTENMNVNATPQIWEKPLNSTHSWRSLRIRNPETYNLYYSWTHLLSSGKVLAVAGYQQRSYLLSIGEDFRYSRDDLFGFPVLNPYDDGTMGADQPGGASVLFDRDKILVVGGAEFPPKTTAEIIDMGSPTPAWNVVGQMNIRRRHLSATLLPNGKVLVTGGNSGEGFNNPCVSSYVYKAELLDPTNPGTYNQTGIWEEMASASQPRLYHSSAVLLPDATVLVGGTTKYSEPVSPPANCNWITKDNTQMEIFYPKYLFDRNNNFAERPVITSPPQPQPATYGQNVEFQVVGAGPGSKVTLIRLPSVTHSFNQNQGVVKYDAPTINGQTFTITIPTNRNECPPGHYMLFVINSAGVPSVAKIIQIL